MLAVEHTRHSANVARDDLYDAGMTIWNSKCFPFVDDCNSTPPSAIDPRKDQQNEERGRGSEFVRVEQTEIIGHAPR